MKAMQQATAYRIVCAFWILQVITPRLDMVPLLKRTAQSGAMAFASMSSYAAACGTVVTFLSLSSWTSRKFGIPAVIVAGCLLTGVLTMMIPLTTDANLLVVQVLLAIVGAIADPVRSAFVDSHSSPDSIGAFTGFAHLVKGLSGVSSQFLASILDSVDVGLPFFVRGMFVFADAVFLMVLRD